MATFGYTTLGTATAFQARDNEIAGTVFTLSEWGWVTKLTVYGRSATGTALVKGCIWKWNDRGLQPLMGVSAEASWSTSNAWRDHTFSSPILLAPGQYLLAVICGDATAYARLYTHNPTGIGNIYTGFSRYIYMKYPTGPTPTCTYENPTDLAVYFATTYNGSSASEIYATYTAVSGVPEKTTQKLYCIAGEYPEPTPFSDDFSDGVLDGRWTTLCRSAAYFPAPFQVTESDNMLNIYMYKNSGLSGNTEGSYGYLWDVPPGGDFSVECRVEAIDAYNNSPVNPYVQLALCLDSGLPVGDYIGGYYYVQLRNTWNTGPPWCIASCSGVDAIQVLSPNISETNFVPCSLKVEWLNGIFKSYYRTATSGSWTACAGSITAPFNAYRPNACGFWMFGITSTTGGYIYRVSNFVYTPLSSAYPVDIFTTTTGLGNYLPVTYSGTTTGYIQLYPEAAEQVTTSVKVIGSDDNEYYISTVWSGTLTPPA